ncbi:kinase-like domain-containing protein [Xylaria palmicola]|nr:kinase-like domain-containing protein [Xylaria palmicola]
MAVELVSEEGTWLRVCVGRLEGEHLGRRERSGKRTHARPRPTAYLTGTTEPPSRPGRYLRGRQVAVDFDQTYLFIIPLITYSRYIPYWSDLLVPILILRTKPVNSSPELKAGCAFVAYLYVYVFSTTRITSAHQPAGWNSPYKQPVAGILERRRLGMSDTDAVAQIFCRCVEKPLPGHFQPGRGFIDIQSRQEMCSAVRPCSSLDISLYPGRPVFVGRGVLDNDISISHSYISRYHFVIYSIEYDEAAGHLVYVRDENSLSGTYVDDHFHQRAKVPSSSGYLLAHGDIIRIDPYWEFHVYLCGVQTINPITSSLQTSETDAFCDRFLITERVLGSGAFARVYLAVNIRAGRQVACKVHRLDQLRQLNHSTDTIRRIVDETNILSRLSHPNLLKFEAAFRSWDTLYTFMELATGGDLFSMRLRPGVLSEMDIKIIIRQILEAVCYLHEQDVTHRDLKPENIFFVTGPTLPARVVVGDLGFAKVAPSGRMESAIGTHKFMAPEVFWGGAYGTNVDIWSIGMISLFMVAFDWDNVGPLESFDQSSVDTSLTSVFDDLSRCHKAPSDNFENFIRACLVVAPSERMTSDMAKDHDWFRSSRIRLETEIKNNRNGWKPARIVHNSVEDIDLIDNATLGPSCTRPQGGRKAENGSEFETDFQYSRHFTSGGGGSTRRKRQKPVVIMLTPPDGEATVNLSVYG